MRSPTHWADDLVASAEDGLSDELFERILALGERARPRLLELATDPAYAGPSGEGGGRVPVAALEILAAMPPHEETASRLVELLAADAERDVYEMLDNAIVAQGGTALAPLRAAVASRRVGAGSAAASDDYVVACCALMRELGAELSADEAAKDALAQKRLARRGDREAPAETDGDPEEEPPARPFPNDPCWCGSGRKYKKCHESEDEA